MAVHGRYLLYDRSRRCLRKEQTVLDLADACHHARVAALCLGLRADLNSGQHSFHHLTFQHTYRHLHMSSISAPSWLLAIPPGTRNLSIATIVLSVALSVLRANANRTVPGLGAVFGASGDSTVAFPWLVLVPGYVIWA